MLLACALLLIALATLWPMPGDPLIRGLCVICGTRGLADLLLNIALFMPLGAALALRGQRRTRITLLSFALSTAIELAQFYIPGRDPSVSDVVANTCGALLGALVVTSAPVWLIQAADSPTRASWLSRTASVLAVLLCLATGLLLIPAYPDSPYFSQWTPELGHFERYGGRVLSATLNGEPLPDGPVHATDSVRAALQSPHVDLEIHAIAGPAPDGLAPLFAIFDQERREVLLLGLDRDDLVLRVYLRTNDARLDRPELRLAAAEWRPARLRPGDTLSVSVIGRAQRFEINGLPRGFTIGNGWGLLIHLQNLPLRSALNIVWIAALFLPAGFWARSRTDAAIVSAAVLVGLGLVPALTLLQHTPLAQWLAAVVGITAGSILQRTINGRFRAVLQTSP